MLRAPCYALSRSASFHDATVPLSRATVRPVTLCHALSRAPCCVRKEWHLTNTVRPMTLCHTLSRAPCCVLKEWHLTNTVGGPLGSDLNAGWLGDDGLQKDR